MPKKKKAIEKLMRKTDIPGLSMASMKNGDIDYTALGVTSCGFYKVKQLPKDEAMTKLDSSRYLLTDEGLYFYNMSTKQLETVTEYDHILKNIIDEISKDPVFHKFNQIPALKSRQLEYIKKETGHQFQPQKIDGRTQFGAASLSKPVFFYLVLKIIEDENLKKELGLEHFNLNTKLADLLPGFPERSGFAQDITVGMALSHQTGVHDPSQDYGAPEILFEPGSQFGYSGFPLIYLQMALEKNTNQTLEQLAQKYVFKPCGMDNSTFLKMGYQDSLPHYLETSSVFPADIDCYSSIAANSLRTTAEDYAKFMLAWMNDKNLSKHLITPVVTLTKDGWAKGVGIEEERLKSLAWGHGIGLQLEKGEVTAVFHNGDMNQWRAVVTMNPLTKTGTVFFSNSHNGDVLTQEITKGVIDAGAACDYMQDKFGFAMAYEDDWEAKQMKRMENIELFIMGKNLDAAKLNLDRASEQLLTAQSALDNIKNPAHKPTGKNDQDWISYEKNALKLYENVTLAEERLKNAKIRYQNVKKMVDNHTAGVDKPKDSHRVSIIDAMINKARESEPETGITSTSEGEWAQEENDYKSSYSLMHRTLTLKSPSPAPKEPSKNEQDKTSNQPQRQEKEEPVRTQPSEDDSYKPKSPFDSMYSGPKPEGYDH
ncbi:TPA: serine hydrolase domain-containing protein [Legionella pneumophila]|nr:beta-lactamase family protein [Legionella pneumophila]